MSPSSTGNSTLTPAQSARLQRLWTLLLHLAEASSLGALEQIVRANSFDPTALSSTSSPSPGLNRRNSLFGRSPSTARSREKRASVSTESVYHTRLLQSFRDVGLTAAQLRSVRHFLARMTPEDVRFGILTAAKHENPDIYLLRFLRVSKWNVNQALVHLLSTIVWRLKEMQVDNVVLSRGELHAAEQGKDGSDPYKAEEARGFLQQFRVGKAFLHGVDRMNRPIATIRIRLHRHGGQSEAALNQYVVHLVEWTRLVMAPPVESADYGAVKFIIHCFEIYYPDSVGLILLHNAPRIFSGVWKIIRPWMAPRMVERIHFTRSVSDLEKFIDCDQIPSDLGGDEDWEYEYIEPQPEENLPMTDFITRDTLLSERQSLGEELLSATSRWVSAAHTGEPKEIAEAIAHREEIIEQLRVNYWSLDPYVRARNNLDRTGVIQDGGLIEMYPMSQPQTPLGVIQTAKVLQVEHVRGRVKVVNV
ncbi:hypothetical protein BDW74DRAFT_189078 [Aspergillus multicolor]|uniref:CRAL-TRIO domain-containing protein n=1 Tax=Aspergillus multicolor TaxID=41759 RepID=UPI003CCD9823